MESEYMLTTIDNPFNPFTNFDDWYAFDTSKGYNTCAYLERICNSSENFTEEEENQAINEAIDEIVKMNILGIYVKINANGEKL